MGMKCILVARMGSSRLPGKTLLPFGERPLLGHIFQRLELADIPRRDIVVCSSTLAEDRAIEEYCDSHGVSFFGGDPVNVSKRVLDCAEYHKLASFLMVLGDNPWIDPGQLRFIVRRFSSRQVDYGVTATPELIGTQAELYSPVGTRIQVINTRILNELVLLRNSPLTREHVSLLFQDLPGSYRVEIVEHANLWKLHEISNMNISINTRLDYMNAVSVLQAVGPSACIGDIVDTYRSINRP
jgi:spore coat polysaccharide biosynthesis protein SpsF